MGKWFSFTTLPETSHGLPLRIWVMGDFGDFSRQNYIDNQDAVYAAFKNYNTGKPIDLWMWLGDNAYCCGRDEEYQVGVFSYFHEALFAQTPIVSVPGNHEYYYASGSEKTREIPYFDIITAPRRERQEVCLRAEAYYSFEAGNVHFIALDSYGLDAGRKLYDRHSEQYQRLIRDLEARTAQWTVVFFHHPPYTKRSHDSDTENDLVELRRVLVPVFDKYRVDLVLSGHSHTYERSYLLRNHTGFAADFDFSRHVIQPTEGKYTASSPPFINKDYGTLYAVVGSAGRLDWNGKPEAHPVSVYANKDQGGSLLLTVDDNRLEGEWVCADGEIRDRFTMFKGVNRVDTLVVNYGEEIELKASWTGSYRWSGSTASSRSIKHRFRSDTVVVVTDSLGYLADRFVVQTKAQLSVKVFTQTQEGWCVGDTLSGTIAVSNENAALWKYQIRLSDAEGNFSPGQVLGETANTEFNLVLPGHLPAGKGYRLRAEVVDNPNFGQEASLPFAVMRSATVQLLPEGAYPYQPEMQLLLRVEGSLPAKIALTEWGEIELTDTLTALTVRPDGETLYRIAQVRNGCGEGRILGDGVFIHGPLSTEQHELARVFPNPGEHAFYLDTRASKERPVLLEIFDVVGKLVISKKLSMPSEQVNLHSFPAGNYIFRLTQGALIRNILVVKH